MQSMRLMMVCLLTLLLCGMTHGQAIMEDTFDGPAGPAPGHKPQVGGGTWNGNHGVVRTGDGAIARDGEAASIAGNSNLRMRISDTPLPEGAKIRLTITVYRPGEAKSADWMGIGFGPKDSGNPFFQEDAQGPWMQIVQGSGNVKVTPGGRPAAFESAGMIGRDQASVIVWTIDPSASQTTVKIDKNEPREVPLELSGRDSFRWLYVRFYQSDPALALQHVKVEIVE
jgi:hypothetical protein